MKFGICRMCHQERALIKSHIIPRSLWPRNENGDISHFVIKSDNESPSYRVSDGIYDAEMVCRQCEDIFNPYDSYAARFLPTIRETPNVVQSSNGDIVGWLIRQYDLKLLKLFVLSLLWRASATSRNEFRAVSLGPHEEKIASLLQSADPGKPDQYQFIITDIYHDKFDQIHFSPIRQRIDGILIYKFFVFNLCFVVNVSQTPFRGAMENLSVGKEKDLCVMRVNFEETHLFKHFTKMADKVRAQHQRRLPKP